MIIFITSESDSYEVTNQSISSKQLKHVIQTQQQHLFEEGPLYLFDRNALERNSTLWILTTYMSLLGSGTILEQNPPTTLTTTTYNDDIKQPILEQVGHDLFQVLGDTERPDHTWMIIGPQRSGAVFHIRPKMQPMHVLLNVYPPSADHPPPSVYKYSSADGDHVTVPLSIGELIY